MSQGRFLHTMIRVGNLDRPDFVLFDLDPGKATFADVVAVAKAIKACLDDLGVGSFVKTSGKSGPTG